MKTILVTGGLGYIGSHTVVELLNKNYNVVVIDNLSNSNINVIDKINEISGKNIIFYKGDIRDAELLDKIFVENNIYGVIHFAGLKAVGESVKEPILYYDNNVNGSLVLFDSMKKNNVKNIIFSSSATVYGKPEHLPIKEDFPTSATNPYGRSKLILEEILKDIYVSDNSWNIVLLRYFNPIGAHKSGIIGENPNGIPNNLLPYISQVAIGKLSELNVYGNDYDTKDGTGVRDYIHVVDLANGHINSIYKFDEKPMVRIYNLGTGNGYSVLEVLHSFEKACGKKLKYRFLERRAGDIDTNYADPEKAKNELNWTAKYGIDEMCEDTWRFQCNYPNGY
ncbi:MAG: UDP-glucose 4-epimerase GalE [Clostridiales bacterium]|nr:MAG: UDP-glucose 4-epimerase GalE [Clostridiales bacterium]